MSRSDNIRLGMTVIEYLLLIAAIVSGLVVMQIHLKRAISSKWRDTADVFGGGRQYEPDGAKKTVISSVLP